jgi:8-oxo-dGTP pyrophosphatase MutT (NUDIX family)
MTSALLVSDLRSLLLDLHENPYPFVPNPPKCKKRASVACIVRVRPTYPDLPPLSPTSSNIKDQSFPQQLSAFFDQEWVKRGDPEILFIKRASRKGDRWTGHVAFPGGKREPQDESDLATGVRETFEEIGLDLNAHHALYAGNLPERVVTTSWGTVPLMVLCPFVYLLTKHDFPPLALQPSEIHSTHWVSLRVLLQPALRTYKRCDISDRLYRQGGLVSRFLLRSILGEMMYSGIRLVPSESLYCSSAPKFVPAKSPIFNPAKVDPPLLLWGLTHGMVADFLDLLPTQNSLELWEWPTLSPWDIRLMTYVFSYRFRQRKVQSLRSVAEETPMIIGEGIGTVDGRRRSEVGGGLFKEPGASNRALVTKSSAVGHMLEGYYGLIRKAVILTLILRLGVGSIVSIALFRWFKRRSHSS